MWEIAPPWSFCRREKIKVPNAVQAFIIIAFQQNVVSKPTLTQASTVTDHWEGAACGPKIPARGPWTSPGARVHPLPSPALTDNALVSSGECLPSRAAVGVEPGAAHIGPVTEQSGHIREEVGWGAMRSLKSPAAKCSRVIIRTNKPQAPQIPGVLTCASGGADQEVEGRLRDGGARHSPASILPCLPA